jgi:Cu+-exporting ATPase
MGSSNSSPDKTYANAESSLEADDLGEAASLLENGTSVGKRRCAVLRITGMSCANCSTAVQRALSMLEPVQKCEVDLINEKATVQYLVADDFDGNTLCEEVDDIGFGATLLQDNEEAAIEAGQAVVHLFEDKDAHETQKSLQGMAGIIHVSASGAALTITYDPALIGSRTMLNTLKSAGHNTSWDPAGASAAGVVEARKHTEALTKDLKMAVGFTGCIVIMCWVLPCFSHCHFILHHELVPGLRTMTMLMCLCALPVMLVCGKRFHVGAWHSIKSGIWDMNVLISLGTGLAFAYSVFVVVFASLAPAMLGFHDCKSPPAAYFETPCMVICFLLVGKFLEAWAKQQTSQSLRDLLALQPAVANLLPSGSETGMSEVVPAELLELDDLMQVYPGEAAPTDSIMVNDGAIAEFDESLLTGESRPVKKRKGDFIVGGSRCVTGRAVMKVERLGSKTTLSQIASLMEKAQLARAPVQQVADVVARIFVPCVVELACLTWVIWYVLVYRLDAIPMGTIAGTEKDATWPELHKFFFVMEHGLTVLLVACPCALGLATPTAVMTSTGVAAKHGILIRSGAVPLELGSKLTHVVLDKTGTLTSGKPQVQSVAALEVGSSPAWTKLLTAFRASSCSLSCSSSKLPKCKWLQVSTTDSTVDGQVATLSESERALWWAIGAAELSSEHPLAKELVNVANSAELVAEVPVTNFENITGVGVKGTVGGAEIFVGSAKRVLQREGNCTRSEIMALSDWVCSARVDGSTVIAVSVDGTPLAAVALRDSLSPHATACVAELQKRGTEVWMCTGDHEAAAQAIAGECGVALSRIVSEALPADKVALVQRLQEGKTKGKRNVVAMVGDGINDAPALAAADLGVAIGAGHNVTVEAADVVLVRMDLRDLVSFCSLARDTLSTIWRNFLWAFLFNSCALPIAAGALFHYNILMTPQIAICLMMSSSLFVVFSSLSLRSFRPKCTEEKVVEKCIEYF